MTLLALAALLPPSALFSFWIARRTTRRLETLAEAAGALRQGDYEARVEVVGQDEVAQLQTDFNAMAGDLAGAMGDLQRERDRVAALLRARRELVTGVSHELRTPVATIRALLESATEGDVQHLPEPLRHDLAVAEGEVLRLQRLIDDLFPLSQAEVGDLAIECRPTDVRPVVRRMVDAFAGLAGNAGRIEVVAELPGDLPPALADAARLEQGLQPWGEIALGSLGGLLAAVIGGWEVTSREVL
jgi:signal transduction histidine kinase